MKKFFILLFLIAMTFGAFADNSDYQMSTDSMNGDQSINIMCFDSETDGIFLMVYNYATGICSFGVTEQYFLYGYNDVEQAMYRFDSNPPVNTLVKLVNSGFTAAFFKDVKQIFVGLQSANTLSIRVINGTDGSTKNYTFELSQFKSIMKQANLM